MSHFTILEIREHCFGVDILKMGCKVSKTITIDEFFSTPEITSTLTIVDVEDLLLKYMYEWGAMWANLVHSMQTHIPELLSKVLHKDYLVDGRTWMQHAQHVNQIRCMMSLKIPVTRDDIIQSCANERVDPFYRRAQMLYNHCALPRHHMSMPIILFFSARLVTGDGTCPAWERHSPCVPEWIQKIRKERHEYDQIIQREKNLTEHVRFQYLTSPCCTPEPQTT